MSRAMSAVQVRENVQQMQFQGSTFVETGLKDHSHVSKAIKNKNHS
uniref:Uncharacterized protein n=1 Tax=Rhizophora mucronata TaxID=61149 RepID=A0A2P2J931_RHIMU